METRFGFTCASPPFDGSSLASAPGSTQTRPFTSRVQWTDDFNVNVWERRERGLPIYLLRGGFRCGGRKSGAANNNPLSSQSRVIKTSAARPTLRTLQISFVNNWFQILKSISRSERGYIIRGYICQCLFSFFRERSPAVFFFFFSPFALSMLITRSPQHGPVYPKAAMFIHA